ncbi:hypothetical protein EAI_15504 [Harpegnathos saltator]|uniref:Uncharacterized protein n=1 Tax=Harpegnathos saltator TaxID=610380 RepID=E2BIP4_HARSA|nr:hypothetical protein EAI_15504 [Harpegnathos saltator]
MSMNPKNILNLLRLYFEDLVYNIQSDITEEEKSFASHLADLMKNAINNQVFIESYDCLSFHDPSVTPDAVLVEEELEYDSQGDVQDDTKFDEMVDLQELQEEGS